MKEACLKCGAKPLKWYRNRLFFVVSALVITYLINLILLYFDISFLNKAFVAFWEYTKLIWWAMLLGLILGGFIDYSIPREYISKHLGKNHYKSIFKAVGLGFLMSACSHGILAISMELYKKGASTPSVIAFLLASPWANMVVTILLFGFFGTKAFLFVGFAIIIALITGLIYGVLDNKGLVEHNPHTMKIPKDFSIRKDVMKRWKNWKFNKSNVKNLIFGLGRGSWKLTEMVLWWLLIGMFLAGLARAYIPEYLFQQYAGPTFIGMLIILILATLIEVCSEGSSPIAFEIFRQTGAFGNSFIFLMAGVATDYTEIGLIWSNIGRKTALWLPLITVPQVLVLAYLFNLLL